MSAMTPREMAGIILWWGEGTKSRRDKRWKTARSYPVEITNTNPIIIKLFVDYLLYDLQVPSSKLHVQLQIHEGDDRDELETYWSEVTGISRGMFNKTIIRPKGHKVGKSKGTCKVRFADKTIYLELEARLQRALGLIFVEPTQVPASLPHYEFLPQSVRLS